ncbi:uncharacterized protein PG986_003668 [Apiospora aurea]|uniref:Uncharacterized protein n=1 Tax=Apiospora aurea TaxID=335848 RepID=A0ABR1QSB5_9PEZI
MESGLSTADASAADPAQLLDREDDSGRLTPPNGSPPTVNGIRFSTIILRTAEKLEWDTRRDRLTQEYNASRPAQQWKDETSEELQHTRQWSLECGATIKEVELISYFHTHLPLVNKCVRDSWIRQGIWEDDWKEINPWCFELPPESAWKHEVEPKLDSETEEETSSTTSFFGTFGGSRKTAEELQQRAERYATRKRESDASRPYHRFLYQLGEERTAFHGRLFPDVKVLDSVDINTKAYETVKARWVERGIWDRRWGILPGLKWKHEQDLEEFVTEELGPRPVTEYGRIEGSGWEDIGSGNGSPPVADPYHDPEPSVVRSGEAEGPQVNTDRARMHDGDAGQSSSVSNLRRIPSEPAQGASSAITRARQSAGAQIMRRRFERRTVGRGRRRLTRPSRVSKWQPKSIVKFESDEGSS